MNTPNSPTETSKDDDRAIAEAIARFNQSSEASNVLTLPPVLQNLIVKCTEGLLRLLSGHPR